MLIYIKLYFSSIPQIKKATTKGVYIVVINFLRDSENLFTSWTRPL